MKNDDSEEEVDKETICIFVVVVYDIYSNDQKPSASFLILTKGTSITR